MTPTCVCYKSTVVIHIIQSLGPLSPRTFPLSPIVFLPLPLAITIPAKEPIEVRNRTNSENSTTSTESIPLTQDHYVAETQQPDEDILYKFFEPGLPNVSLATTFRLTQASPPVVSLPKPTPLLSVDTSRQRAKSPLLGPPANPRNPNLTVAQNNMLRDLSERKYGVLNHQNLATNFTLYANSSCFPEYTNPTIPLRDLQFFSNQKRAKYDEIVGTFQKDLCLLVSEHHNDMADRDSSIIKTRLEDITRAYKDPTLTTHLDQLSDTQALNKYSETLHTRGWPRMNEFRGQKRQRR